jgi:hypothetical protein
MRALVLLLRRFASRSSAVTLILCRRLAKMLHSMKHHGVRLLTNQWTIDRARLTKCVAFAQRLATSNAERARSRRRRCAMI